MPSQLTTERTDGHRAGRLAGIFIYPVKGCRALALTSSSVDALGLDGDRRFLIVDPAGRFITQRSHPQLACIETALSSSHLTLTHPGRPPLNVPRASDPTARLLGVEVWKSQNLQAEDCGEPAAAWISAVLGGPARLVRIGEKFFRPIPAHKLPAPDQSATPSAPHIVSFADAYPFLLIGEASLANLNDRLLGRSEEAVPMNRFRHNLVIAGGAPFAEDTWTRLQIGGVMFRTAGPCARCIVTTTDQETGRRLGPEPLRTLAGYRRDPREPGDVIFGQNLLHETKSGRLSVGDAVTVL